MKEKLNSYIEPQRKGTPKGEPIGISIKKYLAMLYSISDLSQKEIADKLRINHSLMRNWSSEEEFRILLEKHLREFAVYFLKHLNIQINKQTNHDGSGENLGSVVKNIMDESLHYRPDFWKYMRELLCTEKEAASRKSILEFISDTMDKECFKEGSMVTKKDRLFFIFFLKMIGDHLKE